MTHDPVCPCSMPWIESTDGKCCCTVIALARADERDRVWGGPLIAKVRADERKQAADRVSNVVGLAHERMCDLIWTGAHCNCLVTTAILAARGEAS
jgi:hypothetical protein